MYYSEGLHGYSVDYTKALELWNRAVELGYIESFTNIGFAHAYGEGVEVDKKKAMYYWELAAIGGDIYSRHNLGNNETRAGNTNRALKHYMIAVRGGYSESLNKIKILYSNGHATKEDFTEALQSYQSYLGEIKSTQRDKAAAADEKNSYC